jgi:hypothetical protein
MKAIEEEISKQCQSLPRGEYASKALSHSFTVFAHDMVEVSLLFDCFCLDICNVNPEVACFALLGFIGWGLEFLCVLRNLTCAFESQK